MYSYTFLGVTWVRLGLKALRDHLSSGFHLIANTLFNLDIETMKINFIELEVWCYSLYSIIISHFISG